MELLNRVVLLAKAVVDRWEMSSMEEERKELAAGCSESHALNNSWGEEDG